MIKSKVLNDQMKEIQKQVKSGKIKYKVTKVKIDNTMDKEEFAFARKKLGLTQRKLSEILDLSIKAIQGYEQGQNPVPGLVAKTMRFMNSDKKFYDKMTGKSKIELNNDSDLRDELDLIAKQMQLITKRMSKINNKIAA
jgi:DNA-binding transcriptional regulator YiaG